MSLANLITYADYVANGVNTTFSIPFDSFSDVQIEVYLIDTLTDTVTLLVQGGDYTVTPPAVVGDRPIEIETTIAYAATDIIRVQRATSLEQIIHYINNSSFLATDHEKGLDRIVMMVQEISQQLGRSIKISTPDGIRGVNPELPQLVDGGILVYDQATEKFLCQTVATIAAAAGSGLPVGGTLGDFIEMGAALAEWKSANYSGISARFGAWSSSGLKDTLDKIIAITYTPPTISLSGSSNVLREKGATVAGCTLSATIVKKSDPIAVVRFYQGATLLDTQVAGGAIPTGGTSTYAYAPSFTDNISFSAQVDDTGATGGPTTVSSSTSYSFVYPYYYGAGAAGLGAAVAGLTKDITNNTSNYSKTLVSTGGQKLYMAYPASYGALTSILDSNLFEVISTFTATTTNITGLDGNPVSYRIYESNNLVIAGSFAFQFKK